jgi:hypothetical protein
MGGFGGWSDRIRSPLVWLGMANPLLGTAALAEVDIAATGHVELLQAWLDVYGQRPMLVADVVYEIREQARLPRLPDDDELPHLRLATAMEAAGVKRGGAGVDVRSLGNTLRALRGRVKKDMKFEVAGSRKHANLWVVKASRQVAATVGANSSTVGKSTGKSVSSGVPARQPEAHRLAVANAVMVDDMPDVDPIKTIRTASKVWPRTEEEWQEYADSMNDGDL